MAPSHPPVVTLTTDFGSDSPYVAEMKGGLLGHLRDVRPAMVTLADGRRWPLARTYADVPRGQPVALVGSSGYIELAVNGGNARDRLGVGRGAPVEVIGGLV